jgi:putative transcriptional regulator
MNKEVLKNNLKVYRAKFSLTQEELAIKVGVTRKTINTIENGVFIPSALLAIKIAKVFDESVENIFYIEEGI